MRLTLKAINKALKEKGYSTELVRGNDYFYFTGEEASRFFFSGVYVARLNELTLEQWVQEYEEKRLTMLGL